jgi:hypothetical protein
LGLERQLVAWAALLSADSISLLEDREISIRTNRAILNVIEFSLPNGFRFRKYGSELFVNDANGSCFRTDFLFGKSEQKIFSPVDLKPFVETACLLCPFSPQGQIG